MNDAERLRTRHQIENDDSNLEMIVIHHYGEYDYEGELEEYYPPDNDWKREGLSIGRNTHIKELSLRNIGLRAFEFESFCEGLSLNRSISELEVYGCGLWGGDIFKFLLPFLEQNHNLSSLVVDFTCETGSISNGIRYLADVLGKFHSLRQFEIRHGADLEDKDVAALVRMLAQHPKLTKIDLDNVLLPREGVMALAGLLKNPQLNLLKLRLARNSLRDSGASILAGAFRGNRTLQELDLSGNVWISEQTWRGMISAAAINLSSSLTDLNLEGGYYGADTAEILANALTSSGKLRSLNMAHNTVIDSSRRGIFDALRSPHCLLQDLDLTCIYMDEDLLDCLSTSLTNNRVLRHLLLGGISGVPALAWGTFSNVFQSSTALEKVDLGSNSYTNDVLVSFAHSISGNDKLEELYLDGAPVTEESTWMDAFSLSLCNSRTIMDTYNSNHILRQLFDPNAAWLDDDGNDVVLESQLPPQVTSILQLNSRSNSRAVTARHKIIMTHFSGDFSMQPLVDMNLKALPQAIAWMAKDESGSSLLFHYVRYSSTFVQVGVGNNGANPGRERIPKRQKK